MTTTAILLAGGHGSRMNSQIAKQYMNLHDKPVILYSFEILLETPEIDEIVVVCTPEYKPLFKTSSSKPIHFALPGSRRQDSVYNGLMASSEKTSYICVHDGARPFITREMIQKTLDAAKDVGAATVGMPVRYTLKEIDSKLHVKATPDRTTLWEVQTPQTVGKDLLVKGFAYACMHNITVTDDVSLAEIIGNKVKMVEGSYDNIKITVPSDLAFAHQIVNAKHVQI